MFLPEPFVCMVSHRYKSGANLSSSVFRQHISLLPFYLPHARSLLLPVGVPGPNNHCTFSVIRSSKVALKNEIYTPNFQPWPCKAVGAVLHFFTPGETKIQKRQLWVVFLFLFFFKGLTNSEEITAAMYQGSAWRFMSTESKTDAIKVQLGRRSMCYINKDYKLSLWLKPWADFKALIFRHIRCISCLWQIVKNNHF